jgi:hypothetical protein
LRLTKKFPSFSIVVRNASITLRVAVILQEGAAVQLDEGGLDLLLVVDEEEVDAADPQRREVALPAPRDAVAGVEQGERLHAQEWRLHALAVDEVLSGGEADGPQRRLLEVVDAVRVVGEVVGQQRLRERDVEVVLRVYQHVDEARHDRLHVAVGEAESAAQVVADRWPGRRRGLAHAGEGQEQQEDGEGKGGVHGWWAG